MNYKKIKLYHYPSSRSARVYWALHETVGDNFEVEVVPLYDGEQYKESYLLKNPNHCVPLLEITLESGETKSMIESGAMVEWLIDAFPEKNLAPLAKADFSRADYLQMLHFGSTWMDMMLWQIRIHEHMLPVSERDQRTIDRYRSKFVNEIEPQIKERLDKSPYICGDLFSGADCIIASNVMWARGYGLCADEVFRGYLSRVSKREAFIKAYADAHDFSAEIPEGKAIISRFTGQTLFAKSI